MQRKPLLSQPRYPVVELTSEVWRSVLFGFYGGELPAMLGPVETLDFRAEVRAEVRRKRWDGLKACGCRWMVQSGYFR